MAVRLRIVNAIARLVALIEKRSYYYEEIEVKRWILGDGGKAGNCEGCEGNADLGWIDMDALFDEGDEAVDEPPLHPHCTCEVEYATKRKRVYV